jgi:NTP pyrophosphatase (non-canonical NTP hydrolase)
MTAFNGLSDAEDERLALLAEECGEVIQAVGKIFRHGYESHNPLQGADRRINRAHLEQELGHLAVAVRLMLEAHDLNETLIGIAAAQKVIDVQRWLHHQERPDGG